MAYGKIYIADLSKKVTDLFNELIDAKKLNEKVFISSFKEKYPKDYDLLVYEWKFKVRKFKKNKKGHPIPHPIRPDRILSNMYRNYYYKLIMKPKMQKINENYVKRLKCEMGKIGYKIKESPLNNGRFSVIDKSDKKNIATDIQYQELKKVCNQLMNNKKNEGAK